MTEEEDGSWTIEAPDLPGMVAAGASLSAAARYLPDAIDSWIEGARASGMTVPEPTKSEDEYSGRFVLRVAKGLHRRLAELALAEGTSLNTYCATLLAAGLEREVARVAPQAWSTENRYQQALAGLRERATGRRLYFSSHISRPGEEPMVFFSTAVEHEDSPLGRIAKDEERVVYALPD